MRKIALTLILLGLLYSCEKESNIFEVSMQPQGVAFKAIEGGAEMSYVIPNDPKVFAIHVRYKNWMGEDVLKVGGYGSDKIILDGFNKAENSVPVTITLADNNNIESAPIELSFSTLDSAPYAFFDNAKVEPYWGGFQLSYEVPDRVSGMVHVFYVGTNPITHDSDTILVKSFPLVNKEETIVFPLKQVRDKNTVVVRTEDFKGYRVREQVWKDVVSYSKVKYDSEKLSLIDVNKLSVEDDKIDMVGAKYLFDGDSKGEKRMSFAYGKGGTVAEVFTFIAGPKALGKPFIVELSEAKVPASIRIYGMLRMAKFSFTNTSSKVESNLKSVWNNSYEDKLPCKLTVYAGNNKDGNDDEWVKFGSFEQDRFAKNTDRWSRKTAENSLIIDDISRLRAEEPAFLEVNLKAQSTEYRYLKIVVDDIYSSQFGVNQDNKNNSKYVTMHELEVYVKK